MAVTRYRRVYRLIYLVLDNYRWKEGKQYGKNETGYRGIAVNTFFPSEQIHCLSGFVRPIYVVKGYEYTKKQSDYGRWAIIGFGNGDETGGSVYPYKVPDAECKYGKKYVRSN